MTRYVTGWKCMNVKAHAAARRSHGGRGNNPGGKNQHQYPPRPKEKGRWELTDCPNCENGRKLSKKRCALCKKKGKIWTIR